MSEEVIDADINQPVSMEIEQPEKSCVGIRINGILSDMIGYLSDDAEGNRFILENPAEIHYKKEDGAPEGQYKIVFLPCCPSSNGTLFIPYGNLTYVFDPKDDIKSEYQLKFKHSLTEISKTPQYQG
jgi:hypothetical protein